MTAAYERLLDALRTHGSVVKANGVRATAQCPAHEDRNPSLSVRSIEGQALLHCFAGCQTEDVLVALHLGLPDLYDEPRGASYDYTDVSGATVLRTVHRKPNKQFRQSVNDKATVPLYRLPMVVAAIADDQKVYLVEGEKDVHALESLGVVATTAPQGAANWHLVDSTPLHGGDIRVVVDRDAAGDRWAQAVSESLSGMVMSLEFLHPKVGKDSADHVAAGYGLEDFELYEPGDREDHLGREDHADGGDHADPDGGDGYRRNALEDAHLSQRIADDWLAGRYCWAAGLGWMKWDRRRWKHISDAAITEVVRKAHRKYAADEVARGADVARIKALAGLLHASKIRAVVSLARGIVEVESDQFDQHPDLLNVGNGIIDLATGQLGPHDPALYLTRITPVGYRPEAHHADWDRALTALPADVVTWMQLRFGQAASGHMAPDDVMPVLRGSGANGKSTIVKAIHAALGDHAVVIPDRVLLANPGDHPTELMTLRGARLALLEELPEGRHLNVKRLKDTVGTSPITARAIAKDNITWVATHTLMLTTNYLPLVDEVDHGTWRRLALVEFPYTFSDAADPDSATDRGKVEGLRERMVEGAGGRREAVLAWVVAGARRWYDLKKVMPPKPAKVAADTERWRADTDRVYAFFTDRLVAERGCYVTAVDLYTDFVTWHDGHGNKQWSDQTFTARFENHSEIRSAGIERGRVLVAQTPGLSRPSGDTFLSAVTGRPHVWLGVRFRLETDDEAEKTEKPGGALTSHDAWRDRGDRGSTSSLGGNKSFKPPDNPGHPGHGPSAAAKSGTSSTPLLRSLSHLPGRCQCCGYHVDTQGHATDCEEAAA